jgi:hypothetical protein
MHYVDTHEESWPDISRDHVGNTAVRAIDIFSLPTKSKDKFLLRFSLGDNKSFAEGEEEEETCKQEEISKHNSEETPKEWASS